ncbi:MAG TPA: hypothetical protein VGD19_06765 [Allosphingosinicella sp.]|jgi:hypothetical protein
MQKTLLSTAAVAAFLALAACSNEPETVSAGGADPQAEQLKKAPPVTLPPAIRASKTYRCKDNSLIYVTFMTDDVTAAVRDKQEDPPVATLKAPAPGEPYVSEGYSLSGSGDAVTYNSPEKGSQSCKG